ncbi:hypothetical protein KAR91_25805 [Candidatus Pacearchaeota archaeon]|nr:hypothetical protein [Candidatus Pacearchaeota archaeon]
MKKAIDKTVEVGVKLDKVTKGKKTYAMGSAMGIFQMLMIAFPDLLNNNVENAIEFSIGSGLILTVGDKITRKIWPFIKNKYKRITERVRSKRRLKKANKKATIDRGHPNPL